MDIDTFDERKDFTYDKVNFDGLPEYIAELQAGGMRAILILVSTAIVHGVTVMTVPL